MKFYQFLLALILICNQIPSTYALSDESWEDISDVGAYGLIGTALLLPATRKDWEGLRQASYSIGVGAAITLTGKALIDEERPDDSDNDSFPSGHTTNAFASATTLHRRYGWKTGLPAYAVATITGVARERARKHYWYDVVAGAAIGTLTGWYFTDPINDKVQLVPWVSSEGGGVSVSMRW
ncbi:MAG: phosphatase PAP2 family protein [Marinobacter sp.]|uniref:phosphatase PAP2 family protein n=1 Tax=Marinobacter sp. TaxID=50741 RepID=UPI003297A6CC